MSIKIPKIICFSGYSGSGKTTLIIKIIKSLADKGYKVGTIKHTHHNFDIDKPGKDSFLHFHSGAIASMIISEEKMGFIKRNVEFDLERITKKYFNDCDIVILEGFKNYEIPKILVHRKDTDKEIPLDQITNIVAIATDAVLQLTIPIFDINDIESISQFIEKNFLN